MMKHLCGVTLFVCLLGLVSSFSFHFTCTRTKVEVTLQNFNKNTTAGVLYLRNDNSPACSANGSDTLTVPFNSPTCNNTQHNQTFTVVFREFKGQVAINETFADILCYEGDEYRGVVNVTASNLGVKEGGNSVTVIPKTFPPTKAPPVDLTFIQNGKVVTGSIAIGTEVELKLNASDGIHKLSPIHCTATYSSFRQRVLTDYCPDTTLKDVIKISHTKSLTLDQSAVSFTFNTFRLGPAVTSEQPVDFMCSVQICGLNDGEIECDLRTQANCTNPTGRRRRRALEDERGVVQVTQRLTLYDPDLKESANTLSTSAVATIGSSAGAVFIMLSAFFIVLAVRRRKRSGQSEAKLGDSSDQGGQRSIGDRFVNEEHEHERQGGVENSAFSPA